LLFVYFNFITPNHTAKLASGATFYKIRHCFELKKSINLFQVFDMSMHCVVFLGTDLKVGPALIKFSRLREVQDL